ncbi:zingipain-2 [Drosophila obscura]|uniref:zingipain-2 n=1 Tax=Drosophila obscura TaxID=7282 RepID=UPI001BB23F26|nr:zingipain-2 [Drosophila obscura]
MHKLVLCFVLLVVVGGGWAFNHGQDLTDFEAYKTKYGKTYLTTSANSFANYYFIYNRNQVNQHNAQADRNITTYREAVNQFSDIRLVQFAALLPKAVYPTVSNAVPPVATQPAAVEYDILTDLGITVTVEDQGVNCSSSWAYAAAKAVEIMNAVGTVSTMPQSLSAQQLIDCAGMGVGCSTQVPQSAFDYLTQYSLLYPTVDYPNNISLKQQGMCQPPPSVAVGVQLTSYSVVPDGDDTALMRYVSNDIPVVVEYNPATFGFMQYSSGVYQPPTKAAKAASSQFLVVVGYGFDADTNLNYWRCLNSFGTGWGEQGYIRIVRSASQPITKNAIFPNS